MPILTGDFTVHEDDVIEEPFALRPNVGTPDFTLLNRGIIRVIGEPLGHIEGVSYVGPPPGNDATTYFVNEGLLWVSSATHAATGVETSNSSWHNFVMSNTGEIRVTSVLAATGISWALNTFVSDPPFANDGFVNVVSTGGVAAGVGMGSNASFINNGDILATSDDQAIGVGASELVAQTFTNNGTVIAQTTGARFATETYGMRIEAHFGSPANQPDIINNGLLSGGWSVSVFDNSSGQPATEEWIDNNAQMVGGIDLQYGDDRIDNGGSIVGDILMGDGADTLVNEATGSIIGKIDLGAGADTFIGNAANEKVLAGAGNDTLHGNGGDDILNGGAGADSFHGGDGFDTATFVTAWRGVTVSLASPGANTDDATGDSFDSIEHIAGSAFRDTITGDANANTISGLGGADTLSGGDGADTLYGHSQGATGGVTSTVLVNGLSQPVLAATAPGDPGFIYVGEKGTGIIWRVDVDTGARTVFLDIPQSQFLSDGERGVLGLAFHPDYAENGEFFVFMTAADNGAIDDGDLTVWRYTRSASDPDVANPAADVIMAIHHPGQSNHNGGWIGFSPVDGYLYVATGDGGGGGDPNNNAQNINSLLGKILRIDVNADHFEEDWKDYATPQDNPFYGLTNGADEIWAYGVRNPWRAAFDPRNGDLYIGDVGQSAREEVDVARNGEGGLNFGWRIVEGTLPYNPGGPGTPQPGDPSLTNPVFEYDRDVGTTITGGEIYMGANESFVGQYVFADFGSGRIFTMAVDDDDSVHDVVELNSQITGPMPTSVVDFVCDSNGNLYAIGIGGTVWRLTPGAGSEDVADNLSGGAGNDMIDGGRGNDIIDGGRDVDTSSYAVASTTASWHRNANGSWSVTAGYAGTDTLTIVEFLDFTDRDVFLDRAYSTFSGDGTSDIFMQHSSGAMGSWFVGAAGVTGAAGLGALDSTWDLEGVGDFDGDAKDDILMWNDNGFLGMWFMNGASVSSAAGPGAIDKGSWDIEAIGDLNGDGKDDILMWHDNGSLGVWFMNGASATGASLGGVDKAAWDVEGLGDFNGDGKDDILWKDVNGNLGVWFMNGASASGAGLGNIGTAWDIEGLGDFNGDGRDDILMRHDSGSVGIWFMNGASATGAGLGTVSQDFAVAAIGDYNGDGRDDILWWHDNGSLGAWFMNGASATGLGYGAVSHDWVLNPG